MNQNEIDQFHNDLRAALKADIALSVSNGSFLTANRIDNLRQRLNSAIQAAPQSNGELNPVALQDKELPEWYRAALTIFSKTGSMLPVLEGLSASPTAIRELSRALRWTIAYLFIVASMALLGLLFFDWWIVPQIEFFQADLLLQAPTSFTPSFDILPWLPGIIAVLAIGLALGLIWILVGGTAKITSWLGARRYLCCSISVTVLRVAQSLVRANVPVNEAVDLGFALTGAEANVQREVQSVIPDTDEANAIGSMADYMRLIAARRLDHLRIVTPFLLTTILGGGLALIYCLIVFWPIISLLKDLLTAGA